LQHISKIGRIVMVKVVDLARTDQEELKRLIRRIRQGKDQYIVQEGGDPVAAVISIEDFETLESYRRRRTQDFQVFDRVRSRNTGAILDEVEREVQEAVESVRRKDRG